MQPESAPDKSGGFFTSLSGILTGIAGVVTAVATIVGILYFQGDSPGASPESPAQSEFVSTVSDGPTRGDWAREANAICAETDAQLPIGAPQTPEEAAIQMSVFSQAMREANQRLRALEAPQEDRARIQSMTDFWDAAAQHLEAAILAYSAGEFVSGDNELAAFSDPNARGNQIAHELAASACADLG